MSQRTVTTCDRCGQEAAKEPKCVDLPIVRGGRKRESPARDDEFDLCKDCFDKLGHVLNDFLGNFTFKVDRKEQQ